MTTFAGPIAGLYDRRGHRKYLNSEERAAFLKASEKASREVRTLCYLLAYAGCRISEALALTADRIDPAFGYGNVVRLKGATKIALP